MANELLTVPVASATYVVAGASLAWICHCTKKVLTSEKTALMGVLGAFVFAAQMVNFPLPFLPGTSGHMVGSVMLAIILGPGPASIVISSVIIIQCLIFQDGGLLALGCNIINMGLIPCFIGYYLHRYLIGPSPSRLRLYFSAVAACLIAMITGASLVPVQAAVSGVLTIPILHFLLSMIGVHTIIGIAEGLITAAVLIYLHHVLPDTVVLSQQRSVRISRTALYAIIIAATIITGTVLAAFSSEKPDGLEWSYAQRPDEPDFQPIVNNTSQAVAAADNLQEKYSPLPDYTVRAQIPTAGWTGFAAIIGSGMTMVMVWLTARLIRKRGNLSNAPCAD